jgi:transcriptional regulator with XRE-family HTH domain
MTPAARLIRETRIRAGLTQADVAARLGSTQAAVARLESPASNPTVATLNRVLEATGHRLELTAPPATPRVDDAQIIERLKMTPAQRLAAFQVSYNRTRDLVRKAKLDR